MKSIPNKYTKSIIIISSLISIGLVLFLAFSANHYISRVSKNNTDIYSAYKISELMKSFKGNINELESKQRGYIVTGDSKFLEAYKLKETETKTYLKSMEKYFSGKPEEKAFYKLKDLTYKKLLEAKDLNGSFNSNLLQNNVSKQGLELKTMSEIINTIDEINESLSQTTKNLLDNSIDYVDESKRWSLLEIILGVITAIAAVIILIADINSRNKLERELREAKKLADNNAVMKEQFMANMSHEIRTPMNSILGFSDLLGKTKLDKTQTEYLSAVKTSCSNLLNLVNDVLDFSKIEAGKLNIEKISFNLIETLDTLKIMFTPKADEKQLSFNVYKDPKTPKFIYGDPTRLNQILINLINNAIKFTKQGSVSLSIEVISVDKDTVEILFKIKDTGIGIAADKLDSVFERFNQGNTETTRIYGGNGLGLAIVKQLVEIQHGEINVKSKEGVGSEFYVKMAFSVSQEETSYEIQSSDNHLKILSQKTMRILLAEDHKLNQKLAITYLNNFGLDVDLAENGIEAIEKFKHKHYDLILMDIQMPFLDGYDASRQIRQELKSDIPIVAMTANIMADEREKCLSVGMTDYISKPFKEIDLFNIINNHIGNKTTINTNSSNQKNDIENTLISKEHLNSLSRGNAEFIKDIVQIFLNQNPKELIDLEHAILDKNYLSIKSISHKMKTSVGFIGIQSLLPVLSKIEELAQKSEEIKQIELLFEEVKSKCLLASEELKGYV